jgi:energy-coupling factor transporter ATP-binding protein EcfA2
MSKRLTVFPRREVSGYDGKSDFEAHDKHPSASVEAALTKDYSTDAHFSMYAIAGRGSCPRINQSGAAFIESIPDVPDPTIHALVLDFDAPESDEVDQYCKETPAVEGVEDGQFVGHAPDDWLVSATEAILSPLGWLGDGYCWASRGGLKVLFVIESGMTFNYYDPYYEIVCDAIEEEYGLEPDRACSDPGRLQRVPFPYRQHKEKGNGADYRPDNRWHDFESSTPIEDHVEIDIESIQERSSTLAQKGQAVDTDMPTPSDVSPNKSEFDPIKSIDESIARALYEGNALYDDEGKRHPKYLSVVGLVATAIDTNSASRLFKMTWNSAQAAKGGPDDDWGANELWKICLDVAAKHDATKKIREEERQQLVKDVADKADLDPEEVRNHLVVSTAKGGNYYTLDEETGGYRGPFSDMKTMMSEIKDTMVGLASYHDLFELSKSQVVENHGKNADRIVLDMRKDRTELEIKPHERTLRVASARFDPTIEPRYHEEIDRWLRELFSTHTENALDWLAAAPFLEKQVCALYIMGESGCGKTLLAKCLARLFGVKSPVTYAEVMGDFQGGLRRCPIILADENVPDNAFDQNSSAQFRSLIGDDTTRLNAKHESRMDLLGALRLVIAVNDLSALPQSESLNLDSIDAIIKRLGFTEASPAARVFLEETLFEEYGHKEKYDGYDDPKDAWVDGGLVAEHILWLAENRNLDRSGRFLVTGWESKLSERVLLDYGQTTKVGQTIAEIIRHKRNPSCIQYGDAEVYVQPNQLFNSWKTVAHSFNQDRPDRQDFDDAIDVLQDRNYPAKTETAQNGEIEIPLRAIDYSKLAMIAESRDVMAEDSLKRRVETPKSELHSDLEGKDDVDV